MSTVTRSNPFATVIESRPGEVRVRLGDGSVMARWYPSVLADTPVGATGYMLRANQEQMLFIPEGFDLPEPIDAYTKAEVDALITAAGNFPGFAGTGTANTAARSDHHHNATYAAIGHNHDGTYSPATHTHAIADTTGLQTALDGKATTTHNHDTVYAPLSHASNTANPHAVTKAQVGLGNVDNTSDAAKPVSTAQAAAIANFETTTQLNARDTANRNRANHTGNQPISSITNLQEILDGKPVVIDPGNFSTAIGYDAQAPGNSSLAAGHGATATGNESVAVGRGANAQSGRSVAVGRAASAGISATALGMLANASGTSSGAFGQSAKSIATESLAMGYGAQAEGTYSSAIGAFAATSAGDAGVAEISALRLRVQLRNNGGSGNPGTPVPIASTLQLADATGTLHTLGMDATNGLTYDGVPVGKTLSNSSNSSPAAESLTDVGTYTAAGVLRTTTLQAFIPEITTGTWDVDIEAHALVYRSVATGGVILYVGDGGAVAASALGRNAPQTHAYTLNVNDSRKGLTPTSVIDLRYTGFSTAGTTYVINHGWKITARRVG